MIIQRLFSKEGLGGGWYSKQDLERVRKLEGMRTRRGIYAEEESALARLAKNTKVLSDGELNKSLCKMTKKVVKKFSDSGVSIKATGYTLCHHPEHGKYEITEFNNGAKKYTHFDHPEMDYVELADGKKLYRDKSKSKTFSTTLKKSDLDNISKSIWEYEKNSKEFLNRLGIKSEKDLRDGLIVDVHDKKRGETVVHHKNDGMGMWTYEHLTGDVCYDD